MVRTAVWRGGKFSCSFVANLLKYQCAKNYENIMRFDKVIAKNNKGAIFWLHSVDMAVTDNGSIQNSACGSKHKISNR